MKRSNDTVTNSIVKKENPLRGIKGKSIQHHLTILGAERFLPDVYIDNHERRTRHPTSIYQRHDKAIILWAAVKAFRRRVKVARNDKELIKLIEAYQGVKRILGYH